MKGKKSLAFDLYVEAVEAIEQQAVVAVFGELPEYLDETTRRRIHNSIASLRSADQSPERIAALVGHATRNQLIVPGTAVDVTDFIKSANYLAHVRRVIGLGKERAIEELEGIRAARNFRRSRMANDAQYGTKRGRLIRDEKIRKEAQEMRNRTRPPSEHALATKLGEKYELTARHIKRLLAAKVSTRR